MFHLFNDLIRHFITVLLSPRHLGRRLVNPLARRVLSVAVVADQEHLLLKFGVLAGLLGHLYPVYLALIWMLPQTPHIEAIMHACAGPIGVVSRLHRVDD